MNAEEVYALLNKKIKKGGITDDQIRQIVEQYLKDNPVPTDKTLTIEDTPADAKATGDTINAIKDTVDNLNDILLDKFFSLQRTGKIYGVKVPKSTSNPTSLCEKTRDNKSLVCVPSTDTVENQDDYENIPLFKWYEVNYKRYDDGSPVSNSDGKRPCRIQGVEYLTGGGAIASDTVMFFKSDYSKDVYVAPRGTKHVTDESTIKSSYLLVGNIAASTDGKGSDYWTGDVEQNYGACLPTNQVANSGQGNKDILYAGGASTSGTREYYQGGYLGGGALAGFCCLYCWGGLDWALWHCLSAD